jgi:hypothetical protein
MKNNVYTENPQTLKISHWVLFGKSAFIFFLIITLSSFAFSQEIKVYEPKSFNYLDSYHGFFGKVDQGYLLVRRRDGFDSSKKIIELFSNDFEFLKGIEINSLEQLGKLEFYHLNKNNIFYIAHSKFTGSETKLFISEFNLESFQINSTREILNVPNIDYTGKFAFFSSNDGKKLGVRSYRPAKKNFELDYVVGVFDMNFNPLWYNSIVLPFELTYSSVGNYFLSNSFKVESKNLILTNEGRFVEIFKLYNTGKGKSDFKEYNYHLIEPKKELGEFSASVFDLENKEYFHNFFLNEGPNGELKILGQYFLSSIYFVEGIFHSSLLWNGMTPTYLNILPYDDSFKGMVKPSISELKKASMLFTEKKSGVPFFSIDYVSAGENETTVYYSANNYGIGVVGGMQRSNGDIFKVRYDNNFNVLSSHKIDRMEIPYESFETNYSILKNLDNGTESVLFIKEQEGMFLAETSSDGDFEVRKILNFEDYNNYRNNYYVLLSNEYYKDGEIFFVLKKLKKDLKIIRVNLD